MHSIRKLILPELSEVILYIMSAFTLLLVANMQLLWQQNSDGVSISAVWQSQPYSYLIADQITSFEANIDPRIIDFMIWATFGALTILIFYAAQHVTKEYTERIALAQSIHNKTFRKTEFTALFKKIGIQLCGLVLFVMVLRTFFGYIFPSVSNDFVTALLNVTNAMSFIIISKAVAITAIGLYAIALSLRVLLLRTRVFG